MAEMPASEKCFQLSSKILALYEDAGERASAHRMLGMLVEQTSDLGAAVIALNYLPMPEMRREHAVTLVKCAQKVIYNLNLARRERLFDDGSLSEALSLAVSVASDIVVTVSDICGVPAPVKSAGPMPVGFDLPYKK